MINQMLLSSHLMKIDAQLGIEIFLSFFWILVSKSLALIA
jgi:hypothetical protein